MESDSPPRKKLKQARLPFQILSHKESSDSKQSPSSRKRHLSEDSGDDVVVVKAVKKTDESKENVTVVAPPVDAEENTSASVDSSQPQEVVCETPEKTKDESPTCDDGSVKSPEGSILQIKMKSFLANLMEKKPFDITADVGRCDCGCEEADSGEEALEEYREQCVKGKQSPKSSDKTPKEKVKRKSRAKHDSKQSSPSKESPVNGKPKNRRKSAKNSADNNADGEKPSVESDKVADVTDPQSSERSKKIEPVTNSALSQKAVDMFAKWRKPSTSDPSPKKTHSKPEQKSIEDNKPVVTEQPPVKEEIKSKMSAELKKPSKNSKSTEFSEGVKIENSIKSEVKEETNREESRGSQSEKGLKAEGTPVSDGNLKVKENVKEDECEENLDEKLNEASNDDKTNSEVMNTPKTKQLLGNSETPIVLDEKPMFPLTPTGLNKTPQRRLTPKQLERQKEMTKKQEEKERIKLERENEKKRLKLEKDEQKRKEKEEKEELKRKEKEEKEKKKQAEQEQKNEEKRKKELNKAEEKRRKDEEKRKAEEEEERKKVKASNLITSFFVPKSSKSDREEVAPVTTTTQNFMPFEVKADMRVAPSVRHTLTSNQKRCLDDVIVAEDNLKKTALYLNALKTGVVKPKAASKTWPLGESTDDNDVCVLEEDDTGALMPAPKKVESVKAKFLQFHENHRPAYRGTWRKKSITVTGRCPFGQEKILDYEVDSADEWEEEEPGESLHGSDDEKEKESEDEYEVDNSVFVPHGYLSDDEGDEESEEILSPETQKAKLKLLGEEFEAQMKSKTSALKPIIIVLTAALQASSCSARYQKLFERRAVWREDEGPINLLKLRSSSDEGQEVLTSDPLCVTFTSGPGAKKKIISEEAIPALITLIHGNQNKRVFLTNEFSAFLSKSQSVNTENAVEDPLVSSSESAGQPARPSTPSVPLVYPLALKWPGLPPASRISISNKIKEIATWGQCSEEGPMLNRQCWYVPEETRVKYGLVDMKLPNSQWLYTLKPKIFNHSQSPSANANHSSASGADSRALITKFTKVMTPEEKQRQWELMKSTGTSSPSTSKLISTKSHTGKITAFTQQAKSPANIDMKLNSPSGSSAKSAVESTSGSQPQVKKRVALLVSVPRGQQISGSHCSLLSKFEASTVVKSSTSSENAAVTPNNTTSSSSDNVGKDEDCILLD